MWGPGGGPINSSGGAAEWAKSTKAEDTVKERVVALKLMSEASHRCRPAPQIGRSRYNRGQPPGPRRNPAAHAILR